MEGDAHTQWNVEYVACDEMCHTTVPMGKLADRQWRDDPLHPNH